MKTKFASIMASVVTGALLLTSAMPASAQSLLGRDSQNYTQPIPAPNNPQWNGNNRPNYSQRDRVITSYCDRNPRDRDCRGYYGGGWGDREYNNFYSSRRSSLDSIASGLFGFGFGAIIGGALANGANNNNNYGGGRPVYNGGSSYQAHVNACYSRYRSYDEQTNTFMGYDGVRRQCQL